MSPLEHYREAERLLAQAENRRNQGLNIAAATSVAMAQVHATLATVEAHGSSHWGGGDRE